MSGNTQPKSNRPGFRIPVQLPMLTLRRVDRIVAQCVVERMAEPDRQLEEY